MALPYIPWTKCFWINFMIDCPFKKNCFYPKTANLKIIGADSETPIKVCENCPILYQAMQHNSLEESKCMHCQTTLKDIVVSQRIGCPMCYIFIKEVEAIVVKSQNGNTKHIGKKSKNILLPFFKDLLETEKKETPENTSICNKIEEHIEKLF